LQLPSEDDASFDCFEHESIAPSEGKAKLFGREARCLNSGRSPFEQEAQPLGKTSRQFLRDNDNVDVTPQVEVSSCNRSCHYRGQEIDAFGEVLNVAFRRPDQFQLISSARGENLFPWSASQASSTIWIDRLRIPQRLPPVGLVVVTPWVACRVGIWIARRDVMPPEAVARRSGFVPDSHTGFPSGFDQPVQVVSPRSSTNAMEQPFERQLRSLLA